MPGIVAFSARERKTHDANLKAAIAYSRKAAAAAKTYHANLRKILAHSEKVSEAATASKLASPASQHNLHDYEIMGMLTELGSAIVKAGTRSLSKTELRKHHQNLAAVISLTKKNADGAKQISSHLMGIHKSFSRIVNMYK